eukprot:EG_transcript_8251
MVLAPRALLAPRLSVSPSGGGGDSGAVPGRPVAARLRRLLYASRAADPAQCDALFLRAIGEQSQARNRRDNITGFLVYSVPFFFQVIEGPNAAITRLYNRLLDDSRHVDRVIILDVSCSERLYADWDMKVSDMHSIALHPTIATVLSRFGASFISMWPYLPGNAATLLVQGKNPIREAPEQVQVVTAFVHIAGFPGMVRQPALSDFLVDVLELFVDSCTRYITESGGHIAKFINGTCMAYWPADSASNAIAAVQNVAARFRASRETEPDWSPLSILHTSAGLHFGGALLCNAGQQKSDFTLLGDSINTTARIAALALQRHRPLLLSGAVVALLEDRTGLCSMGTHTLRGREGGVECFHFNEPELPAGTNLSTPSMTVSMSQYRPRHHVRSYGTVLPDELPPLFDAVRPHPLPGLTSSFFCRAASWVLRTHTQEDLLTLTYISRTSGALSYHDVNVIQQQGSRHNAQEGITACLLQLNDAVVQTLEGPPGAVLPLWHRIRADPRHNDVVAVHMAALPRRQHREPLEVMRITDDMMTGFPALPDILTQLARSFLCLETYVPSVVVRHIA